jgi:hypothetical protein
MRIKQLICSCALAVFVMASFNANAKSVDVNAARTAAGKFLQQNMPSKLRSGAMPSIKLSHAEASKVSGNAYYVFNIDGGGWVIIAGDDQANEVLAYGTEGSFDMSIVPDNMKGYLNRFKDQIEFMQNFKGEVAPMNLPKTAAPVGPLLKTDWAQGNPFNRQCPQVGTEYCSVGCAGLAMAQILNYWEYPKSSNGLPSYRNEYSYSYVPALGATTFDYDLIVDHYTTWQDGSLYLLNTTQEQKDEVAKLCRYASQSCKMNFSTSGSGSTVTKQKYGFVDMGYSNDAKILGIEAWPTRETWNTTDYTDEEWVELINAQLEARRPIPYSVENDDGHAFVIDGIDANGLYHINWGWYGRCDGWFQYGAFNVTPQNTTYYYNDYLFMIVDLYPYEGYEPPTGDDEFGPGDVDHSGGVDIDDITALIAYVLNPTESTIDTDLADLTGEGTIDIDDVVALISRVLGN